MNELEELYQGGGPQATATPPAQAPAPTGQNLEGDLDQINQSLGLEDEEYETPWIWTYWGLGAMALAFGLLPGAFAWWILQRESLRLWFRLTLAAAPLLLFLILIFGPWS